MVKGSNETIESKHTIMDNPKLRCIIAMWILFGEMVLVNENLRKSKIMLFFVVFVSCMFCRFFGL